MNPASFNNLADEELARQAQAGAAEAFSALVHRYSPKITRYGYKILFKGDDVKDLVQDIFIKAYENLKSFDADKKFSPWIYRIAHNEYINAIRKKSLRQFLPIVNADLLWPNLIAKNELENDLDKNLVKETLDQNLDKLDLKYREPLILYYLEDQEYKEIADILKIPVATVGVRIRRGKEKLKQIIQKNV